MIMTVRHLGNACLAFVVLLAACNSGRATGDASTTSGGGTSGSAGTGGGGASGASGSAGSGGSVGRGGGGGGGGGTGGGGVGGGGGTDSGDAGTIPCGDTACAAGQVCLRTVIGAASYVCPDAGQVTFPPNCDGRFLDSNGCCFGAETSIYSCVARPGGCGATVTCACAASTICRFGTCSELGASEIACLTSGV